MKKTLTALLLSITFAGVSYAQVGGFKGPTANVAPTTVKQALDSWDDTKVTLRGHIVNNLGHEKYTFTDGTAEIIIDIDDEDWMGRTVGPEDTIEIYGEVDKDMFRATEIDVDSFKVIPAN